MSENSNTVGVTYFWDYVRELPHQWILDNLISDADKSRRILSSAMVKEAVAKFTAKAALVKRFDALAPELKLKCAQVYLLGGNGFGLTDPVSYADDPLLTSLFVFAAQNESGANNIRFFGFDEFEPVLRPLMAETLAGKAMVGECSVPVAGIPWRPLSDVAAVCSLALHGGLSRNTHGGLSRSSLNALKRLVHDPTLTGKSVSEGLPGHPAGFLIGFCLKESLIIDADEEYALNRQKLAAWLEKSMKERLNRITAYASEYLGGFGLELMRELLERAGGRWLSVNSLVSEDDCPMLIRALNALSFLGRVHINPGNSANGVRFTFCEFIDGDVDKLYADEPKRDTLIMPDFSVIIPQEVSPAELFDFSKIGQLAMFDKVYKGRITKESVSNALSVGIDPAYLREWLRARRAATNVVKTVDEWIREFSRLFVSREPVLVSSDEKVTRQIASLEPLRKYLTEMPAHTVFSIKSGSEQKVLDILEKLNFDTRMPHAQTDIVKHEDKSASVPLSKKLWTPLTEISTAAIDTQPPSPMNRTKYGAGLKALNIDDMIHVIDYAILTGQALTVDYDVGANAKQSVYTVIPTSIDKGMNAAIEAELPNVRGRKLFYLSKVKRIGVVSL